MSIYVINKVHFRTIFCSNLKVTYPLLFQVVDRKLIMNVNVNSVYTLTTISRAQNKSYPKPPGSEPFILPYIENFDSKHNIYELD